MFLDNFTKIPKWIFLVFAILFLFLFHAVAYLGHFGYDDMEYAEIAANLLKGNVDYSNHFVFRAPTVLITGFFYLIFGINDFASAMPAVVASSLILWLVYDILKNNNHEVVLIGLVMTLFSNWFIFYSDKIMPDIFVALFLLLMFRTYYKYRLISKISPFGWPAFWFAFWGLWAFISKETAILVFPSVLFFLIQDVIKERNRRFWVTTVLFSIVFFGFYLLVIKILTGNFLQRFHSIAQNAYINDCSYGSQPFLEVLKRIGYEFWGMLIHQGMAFGVGLAILSLFYKQAKFKAIFLDQNNYFGLVVLICILSANFLSISLSSYSPMCTDPRHFLYLIPLSAIAGAPYLNEKVTSKKNVLGILILLMICIPAAYFLDKHKIPYHYGPILILFVFLISTKRRSVVQVYFSLFFSFCLFLTPIKLFLYSRQINYDEQKNHWLNVRDNQSSNILIVTDKIQKRLADYYNGFENTQQIRDFEKFNPKNTSQDFVVFVNKRTLELGNLQMNQLPKYMNEHGKSARLLTDNILEIKCFKVVDDEVLQEEMYRFSSSFEEISPALLIDTTKIHEKEKRTGNNSLKVNSSTVLQEISIENQKYNKLWLEGQFYAKHSINTSFVLKLTWLDTNNKVLGEDNLELNNEMHSTNEWWAIHMKTILENAPRGNLKLRIELIQKSNDQMYIDDYQSIIQGG